jgi:hypothetical protein
MVRMKLVLRCCASRSVGFLLRMPEDKFVDSIGMSGRYR